jgi:hypothetical protein
MNLRCPEGESAGREGVTYRELRSHDVEAELYSPPTCEHRAGNARVAPTELCRACSNACLADYDRNLVDMFAQAYGISLWIFDAVRIGYRRPAHFLDQQYGDAHPEPEG